MSDIIQQLQQLVAPILASPKGQAMAQAVLSQMGGGGITGNGGAGPAPGADPRARMAQAPMGPPTGQDQGNPVATMRGGSVMGRGPATDMEMEMMDDANSGINKQPTQYSTEDELEAARQAMGNQPGVPNTGGYQNGNAYPHGPGESEYNDNQGHMDQGGGINKDGPTPQEAQMLRSNPSPRNQANFDKLFGKGAAQLVLGSGGGQNLGTAPGSGGGSYEDDVRGAMSDGDADDESDHEYR